MKKGLIFLLAFFVFITVILHLYQNNVSISGDTITHTIESEIQEVSLNEFISGYDKNVFDKIELIDDKVLKGFLLQKSEELESPISFGSSTIIQETYIVLKTNKPLDTSITDLGISLTGSTELKIINTQKSILVSILEFLGPVLIFMLLLFFMFRFIVPKGGGGFPFSIKVGKMSNKKESKTRFKDIAGMQEVKAELEEIVDYLKNPIKYQKVGARHPKGVLLYGQPGSGKTLLARAVAGEANVPFFSASGSEFMEMLVGMGAAKVRELFDKAKTSGRAIIFIDEIDAIGKRRGAGYTGGHQEQEQTLNQILTEMDGFDNNTNIIVIAATNRPDVLDPALLRAGRFDRKILVSRPTYEERLMIFEYYLKSKTVEKGISIESIAKRTSGLVGADIENIVNEAALKVARDGRKSISNADFEYALEKTIMGPEKKIKSISDQEKNIVTYHELGHAITAHVLPNADPVEKISIVSRGQALGVTWMMPKEDKYLYSKSKFLDDVVSLLGGRAAEEIFFGKDSITTGASNDFQRATKIIFDMITKYGMDEDIGTINYQDDSEGFAPYKPYSEKTGEKIDEKVRKYTSELYKKSLSIIKRNKKLMKEMAELLLLKEYISRDEFENMMKNSLKIKEYIQKYKKEQKKLLEQTKKMITIK